MAVERVAEGERVGRLLFDLADRTRVELLTTVPGGPHPLDYLRRSWDKDVANLARGVNIKALYQADTARRPETLKYLAEFAAAGAQVRVLRQVPNRMIILDRELCVVAADPATRGGPALVVREPVLVQALLAQFDSWWAGAHPVGVGRADSLATDSVLQTLQILRSGATDDAVARQLGVSVRTVRRRVAAVLDLLGAGSRFEAGVRAAEAGWL